MSSTWRLDKDGAIIPLDPSPLQLERQLEDVLETHPEVIFGESLLVVGRQPSTDLGKALDLLAIDARGRTVIAELKRGQTPRDVVAQALEYSSYIATLDYAGLNDMACDYFRRTAKPWQSLGEAHTATFAPDEAQRSATSLPWNGRQRTAIVAEDISEDVARVCRYLRGSRMDVSAVRITLLRDRDGDRFIVSDLVVGDEPTSPSDVISTADVEDAIPADLRDVTNTIRSYLAREMGLREYVTPTGFSFGPRSNPRDLRVAGLYFYAGKLSFYAYALAMRQFGGDAEAFYRDIRDRGFETTGVVASAIFLRREDVPRIGELLNAFRTHCDASS